ncbi:hypothetical protein DF188_09690 [Aliarcobacter skirrowii]|uniref:Uncharacterized protein n=1 Tax=Aliarcobacter skirrowii TaxID=28200 RepID=A0A2U2BYH4_9BACT|nr:hypothetical protein [Aliarcobacter skirrowii]PWE19543.1 hypothetical protein DF188_09690 [Aliarcobacter skirrowii]
MNINNEEIEKFNNDFGDIYWENIIKDIKTNIYSILKNELLDNRYKIKPNINLIFNEANEGDIFPKVIKINKHDFEILINIKLLRILKYYSWFIIQKNPFFEGFNPKYPSKCSNLADHVFIVWIFHIIFHEFAHIINGHFEAIERTNKNLINFEIDADWLGTRLTTNYFVMILNGLIINLELNNLSLVKNFFRTIFFLIYLFTKIKDDENNKNNTHPNLLFRITILGAKIAEVLFQKKDTSKLDKENILEIVNEIAFEYAYLYHKDNNLEIKNALKFFNNLYTNYKNFKEDIELFKYNYFK